MELLASIPGEQPLFPDLSDINVDIKKLGVDADDFAAMTQMRSAWTARIA